jgi:hypothetical protein
MAQRRPITLCYKMMAGLCALGLLLALSAPVRAANINPNARGSLSLTLKTAAGTAVPGGSLKLYRVGVLAGDAQSWRLSGDFAGSGLSLDRLTGQGDAALAARFAAYAKKHGASGISLRIDGSGRAAVSRLSLGVYLVTQPVPAKGYRAVSPFLVSIPLRDGDTWQYAVDATPKMRTVAAIKPKPKTPPKKTVKGRKLPQTGQLKWPIPVMAAAGMLLFALGWKLRFSDGGREARAGMPHESR